MYHRPAATGVEAPLVGRRRQLDDLHDLLNQAIEYQTPQIALLVGGMGVGKTRLINHWLVESKRKHTALRFYMAAARADGPAYGLFNDLLRSRFRLDGVADPADYLRAQVEEVLGDQRVAEVLHFIGSFVGLSVTDNPFLRALEEEPAQQEQIARTVLARFLEQDAERSPVVLVLEDLHLADLRSLSLFRDLAAALEGAPLMVLASCRPELYSRCQEFNDLDAETTRIDMPLMTETEGEALLNGLLGATKPLPESLVRRSVQRSQGNPLFMRQLVRILADSGVMRLEGEEIQVDAEGLEQVELPISMEEAMQARVGMLSVAERDVLEKAAVFGKTFWVEGLVCLARMQQETDESPPSGWMADVLTDTIRQLLSGLIQRDFVTLSEVSTIADNTEFGFKNDGERQLIYSMIPPQKCKQYHQFVAQWLETRVPQRSEALLERLGQHYEIGGSRRRAAFYFVHAGDRARARYANEQAVAYYTRGLDLLGLDDVISKVEALSNLGEVCSALGRNEQALEYFTQMLRYAWLLDHKARGGDAHHRVGKVWGTLGEFDMAVNHLTHAVRLQNAAGQRTGAAASLDELGKVAWLKGEYEEALGFHRRAMEIQKEEGEQGAVAASLNNIGRVHRDSGSIPDALQCFSEALDVRRAVGDRLGVVDSLNNLGRLYRAQSEYGRALELWSEALDLARQVGARLDEAYLRINLGEAKLQLGKPREAKQQLHQALELGRELGDRRLNADCARVLAEVLLGLGDTAGARKRAEEALQISVALGLKPERGLALRTLAEVLVVGELDDETAQWAAALFGQAIEIFSELGNDLELARTFASFSQYHDRLGAWDDADHFRSSADDIFSRLKEPTR